jgi:hypothetical protein
MKYCMTFAVCLLCIVYNAQCMPGNIVFANESNILLVAVATTDITPNGSVALAGQMYTRIAQEVRSPITATALAIESRDNNSVIDQAIMVSCDLLTIPQGIIDQLRQDLKNRLLDFDVNKLLLSATHTHTAPVMKEGIYDIPEKGIIKPAEYARFLTERLSELVVNAWEARKPGAVSWGLGHAVVAQNRRAVYADGHAEIYGRTDVPNFRNLEGYEDHGVDVLFFWNQDRKLLAIAINIACPAQTVEGDSSIDADFWHEVREKLRKQYSPDLLVLGWVGAAGDQSPHLLYRKVAEGRMLRLRGLTQKQEIARRICRAVDEAYEVAQKDIQTDIVLIHRVEQISLPVRQVTYKEMSQAKKQVTTLEKDVRNRTVMIWHKDVIDRYERQSAKPYYDIELHVIRIGNVVICTNPFELFTDYGIQIKARSKALQTFVIQLTGRGGYLPTEKAVRGGGYSAIVQSNLVGPEGGQVLVDKTVDSINVLWSLN